MADNQYELKNVAVRLVSQPSFLSDEKIETPEAAVRVLAKEFADYDREVLSVVNLNVKGKPINASIVSMGILDGSLAHPREILKTAILSNAAQILILHNHPSNELKASRYDIHITDRMQKACDLMLQYQSPETVCGLVENIGREGEQAKVLTLAELREENVNMFTTVFIGNSQTQNIDGKMVTPRGYTL